jgi:hypothetical protein
VIDVVQEVFEQTIGHALKVDEVDLSAYTKSFSYNVPDPGNWLPPAQNRCNDSDECDGANNGKARDGVNNGNAQRSQSQESGKYSISCEGAQWSKYWECAALTITREQENFDFLSKIWGKMLFNA